MIIVGHYSDLFVIFASRSCKMFASCRDWSRYLRTETTASII